jgi:hypothetical protein
MNPLQSKMLSMLAGAAVVIAAAGTMGTARADAFAQSILVIDNFRLLHSNGTPFTSSDFPMLGGTNEARASGELNGRFAGDMQSSGFTSGVNLDIAHQFSGNGSPPRLENNFNSNSGVPFSPGGFGFADQRMAGSMITTDMGAAGALVQTRADALLTSNGSASGGSGVATSATFNLALGMGEYMTIAFDAMPYTRAFVNQGDGTPTSASARLSWNITLLDLTTGATVFSYSPDQLNGLADSSRTDGDSIYAPGWLSFAATTDLLTVGDVYQITIFQSTLVSTLQSQRVPEPGMLAVFGAGLLAMAALSRRPLSRRPLSRRRRR